MSDQPELVLGIDVGGTSMKGVVGARDGTAVAELRRPTPRPDGPEAVTAALLELCTSLLERGRAAGDVRAAGLAVPGIVDADAGVVRASANLGWRNVPLREIATGATGVPAVIGHDVRLAAAAEAAEGAGRDAPHLLFVGIGTGIGGALLVHGRPLRGGAGAAGELGHVSVDPRGPLCVCGKRGCLEALASASAIERRHAEVTGEAVPARVISERAARGEAAAARIWSDATSALGRAIGGWVMALDPDVVILGGGLAEAGETLLDPVREAAAGEIRYRDPVPIVAAELGEEAGRRGAALAAWELLGR